MSLRNLPRRLVLVAAVGLVAASCASSGSDGQTVYRDPEDRSLFSLPAEWNLYDSAELSQIQSPLVMDFGGPLPVVASVGFDRAPGANVANLNVDITTSAFPIGAQVIRSIGSAERDTVSRGLLESATFSYAEGTGAEEVIDEDFAFGDFHGIRRLVGITDESGTPRGVLYFVSVTDPADSLLYSMAAGCSFSCWEQYQGQIVEVVDSWLVNTKR
jgi:hypothetical protein